MILTTKDKDLLTDELQNDILVLGIGNLLMNDEGVGIHVVRNLETENLPGVDVMDGGTGGLHLLGIIQSYRKVIFIDAALDEFPAGTVRVLHPKFAKDFPKQLSAHEIGFKDLLDAAMLLGNVPELHLIAISVKDFQDMGMQLSPEVEASIPNAVSRVKELLTIA
ncbi:MAG: hydrogenase maturation protease [Bacteroidota bacterium]